MAARKTTRTATLVRTEAITQVQPGAERVANMVTFTVYDAAGLIVSQRSGWEHNGKEIEAIRKAAAINDAVVSGYTVKEG